MGAIVIKHIIITLFAAYFIGAIPFSYIISITMGKIDIRQLGSGNVGTTNVVRNLGWKIGILAFSGDLLKGVLATWIGMHLGGFDVAAIAGIMAIIGHCWPIFLGFKGGKGVATAAGVILYLMPDVVLGLLILFIIVAVVSRYISLASITVALFFPLLVYYFNKPISYFWMSLFFSSLVLFRHRGNMKRLINGNEPKIKRKFI